MKQVFILAFAVITSCIFAQNSQKKYGYAIVPVQYAFTKEVNQFQLNVLTRMLLQEEGLEVYMDQGEEMPQEIIENQCLTLKVNVVKDKGLFTTNLRFQLFNCYGNLVFEGQGASRKKAFKDAYQEALRAAIQEFQDVSYRYVKKNKEESAETKVEITANQDLSFEERASIYRKGEDSFWLLKDKGDYILYLDKGETVLATLKQAGAGTYAYDSENIDGAAYFTPDGDLVVEYLAKNKDAVQKLTFKRQ
jgi:hypothetical protein